MLDREKYLDTRELELLLRAARTSLRPLARRDYTFLAVLANTGVRPGEAIAVRLRDTHATEHDGRLRIYRLKSRRELGKVDDAMLSRPLARVVRRYVRESFGAGAQPEARLFPFTVRQAERIFHTYREAAGLPGHLRLYCLRHTFLTRAAAASGDPFLVQRLAGHASLSTTQTYTHADPARLRKLVELAGAAL